jgi:hypothetical protein
MMSSLLTIALRSETGLSRDGQLWRSRFLRLIEISRKKAEVGQLQDDLKTKLLRIQGLAHGLGGAALALGAHRLIFVFPLPPFFRFVVLV